jgi:hypothetical protein
MRGGVGHGGRGGGAAPHRLTRRAALVAATVGLATVSGPAAHRPPSAPGVAADTAAIRLDQGRFSVLALPQDRRLASALLAAALQRDTFPGLPRPDAHVVISVAPDAARFRALVGPAVPEWGAAVALPASQRIVVQGGAAPSAAGDPAATLRHELAHLALHEYLDDLAPRWFDEGYASYAAGELTRDEVLAANVALALRGVPTLASLDSGLVATEGEAAVSYALAYRAVADLASLDPERGLTLLFRYWRSTGSLDAAVRGAYGEPLDTFEAQWRARTRRRYGALALVSDLAFATVIFLTLLAPLYVARRRRDRARMAALQAAEDAAAALPGEATRGDGGSALA